MVTTTPMRLHAIYSLRDDSRCVVFDLDLRRPYRLAVKGLAKYDAVAVVEGRLRYVGYAGESSAWRLLYRGQLYTAQDVMLGAVTGANVVRWRADE